MAFFVCCLGLVGLFAGAVADIAGRPGGGMLAAIGGCFCALSLPSVAAIRLHAAGLPL